VDIQQHHSDICPRAHTAKGFIRALLNPDPDGRLSAQQALAHPWLTTFSSPTEHDLSGLRENFDPRARWRNAIGAARVLSRFSNKNGAGANKDKLLISDDEDEDAENGTKTSWRATPDTKETPQQQQRSSPSPPSLPDNRSSLSAPRQGLAGLAGLVASSKTTTPTKTAKTTTTTTPPLMSFTEAIKARAAAEKSPNSRASPSLPKTQSPVPVVSQRGNDAVGAEDEDEDEDEDMTMRIPGSFDLEDYEDADGAAGSNAEPFDAIGALGDLWRRMQLRR